MVKLNLQKIVLLIFSQIILFYIVSLYPLQSKIINKVNGLSLICKAEYQILGYEFLDENMVIRYALSKTENDYYDNSGTYEISQNTINLDIEGDLFKREISLETFELFIGVHSNSTLVCKCERFEGNLKKYFNK